MGATLVFQSVQHVLRRTHVNEATGRFIARKGPPGGVTELHGRGVADSNAVPGDDGAHSRARPLKLSDQNIHFGGTWYMEVQNCAFGVSATLCAGGGGSIRTATEPQLLELYHMIWIKTITP